MKVTAHLLLVSRSKNEWNYTSIPQYAFKAWCWVKAQGINCMVHGLSPLARSNSELTSETVNAFTYFGGTPRTGDRLLAKLLPVKEGTIQKDADMHASSGIWTQDPCSSISRDWYWYLALPVVKFQQTALYKHVHVFWINISYQVKKDIISKISEFLQIFGILNDALKPNLVGRRSRLNVCNILAELCHHFYMAMDSGYWNKEMHNRTQFIRP